MFIGSLASCLRVLLLKLVKFIDNSVQLLYSSKETLFVSLKLGLGINSLSFTGVTSLSDCLWDPYGDGLFLPNKLSLSTLVGIFGVLNAGKSFCSKLDAPRLNDFPFYFCIALKGEISVCKAILFPRSYKSLFNYSFEIVIEFCLSLIYGLGNGFARVASDWSLLVGSRFDLYI